MNDDTKKARSTAQAIADAHDTGMDFVNLGHAVDEDTPYLGDTAVTGAMAQNVARAYFDAVTATQKDNDYDLKGAVTAEIDKYVPALLGRQSEYNIVPGWNAETGGGLPARVVAMYDAGGADPEDLIRLVFWMMISELMTAQDLAEAGEDFEHVASDAMEKTARFLAGAPPET